MALTYAQTYAAEKDSAFLGRLAVSLAKTGQAIQTEGPAVALHSLRSALAKTVLMNLDGWAAIFAINVALAPNIQAAASLAACADADIDNQVSAIWNSYI